MEQERSPAPLTDKEIKEKNLTYLKELTMKTSDASTQLGNQVFACPPFGQNYDNWLVDLRHVVSDFESNSPIKLDEQFVKESSQSLLDVETTLAQIKIEESKVGTIAKSLADNNHLLVEVDKKYAEKARELSLKRESEVERLTNRIHELESEVQKQEEDKKRKIIKGKTEDTISRTKQELKSANEELEAAQRNSTAEQDKLHEDYEKQKQDITAQVECLRQELQKLESDTSLETRQATTKALADAINTFIQRT
jgi:DNA repair exonuclease SbcCD ATPase subunit